MDQHACLSSERGRRFAVVGTTGSGKTTVARRISERLSVPHVELDALHWGPDWTPAPLQVFRERTVRALDGDAWVSDGNYGKVRDIVWRRADTVVWLDYALVVILGRLTWRTLRRIFTQEDFERAIKLLYEIMGCDPETGRPHRGKLLELGLGWVDDLLNEDTKKQ